tara:strand:+ start:143 stop:1390 length:1248 start_codon:yes stop_codon:yes gene_type:complete
MSRILLLTDHASYRIATYIDACARLDVDVIIASEGRSSLVPDLASGVSLDPNNYSKSLETLSVLYESEPFSGIVATDDSVVRLAAAVGDRFNLPTSDPVAVEQAQRKDSSRVAQRDAGLRVPNFQSVRLDKSSEIQVQRLNSVTYPCVAKPVTLSASRGVIRANNEIELLAAFSRISAIIESAGPEHPPVCLVEDYIEGKEYVVEGLINRGEWETIGLIEKPALMEGPFFEETIYLSPAEIPDSLAALLTETVENACRKLNITHGPIHAECRVNDDGAWLIELGLRTIGGRCSRIVDAHNFYKLEELVVLNALGIKPIVKKQDSISGVMMIPVATQGILRRVEGLEKARAISFITGVEIDIRPGEQLVPWPEGFRYPGFIFARGDEPSKVEGALWSAFRCLTFVVAPNLPVTVAA